jgi:phytoene dehydrogenase-like protein
MIVIGAGIAGLSAGCYGQMNGYRTSIMEMADRPGGLCTSWRRNGFLIEGSIHWLVGSHVSSPFYQVWRELGAVQDCPMVQQEEHLRIEGLDGRTFVLYSDADRLAEEIKSLSPRDARPADELAKAIVKFARFDVEFEPPAELLGPVQLVRRLPRFLPFAADLVRYSRLTLRRFAERFHDPLIRDGLCLAFDVPDFPLLGAVLALSCRHAGTAAHPLGGSLALSRAIEGRYQSLGGTVHYRSRVERVLVEGNRAVGVRLVDGTEHRADVILSAADGRSTIFDMLEGRFADESIRRAYESLPAFQPFVQASVGVARDLSTEPHLVFVALDRPLVVPGREHRYLGVKHYGYDPTYAPAGKSLLVMLLESRYQPWAELAQKRKRYDDEKQRIADDVVARLDRRLPGLAADVEMTDVTTPLTYERRTGNWQGSYAGWQLTTKTLPMLLGKGLPRQLPGLERLYLAGHWVTAGGGVPNAAITGRAAIQLLCHHDGKRFTTSLP